MATVSERQAAKAQEKRAREARAKEYKARRRQEKAREYEEHWASMTPRQRRFWSNAFALLVLAVIGGVIAIVVVAVVTGSHAKGSSIGNAAGSSSATAPNDGSVDALDLEGHLNQDGCSTPGYSASWCGDIKAVESSPGSYGVVTVDLFKDGWDAGMSFSEAMCHAATATYYKVTHQVADQVFVNVNGEPAYHLVNNVCTAF